MLSSLPAALAAPLAWLLPNHYPPWPAAWPDGLCLALLALSALATRERLLIGRSWVLACALAAAVAVVQWLLGRIHFGGDVWMVLLYLLALTWALALGGHWAQAPGERPLQGLDLFLSSVLVAATLSVGIALVQWTGALSLGIWQADMPQGGRPFGNVAQPNHLCSIAFLGIVAVGWLRERGRVGVATFWLALGWMLFGMVLTGSRTGLLQFGFLAAFVLAWRNRMGFAVRAGSLVAAALVYLGATVAWPSVSESLHLAGRLAEDTGSAGTRPLQWKVLLTAIMAQPWWGYGWQQVGLAQLNGVDAGLVVGEHIEHAHNLLLDLLIWNGIPLGLLLFGILVWIYASRMLACRSATAGWLLIGIGGLGVHALLEFPHEFAYFLVPLGLMAGAADRLTARSMLPVGQVPGLLAGLAFAGLLAAVAVEYLRVEVAFRSIRMEAARIGTAVSVTPVPELRVLTQSEAWLTFTRTPATPGMSPELVDWMRRVSERFAHPPALLRYGLAAGLNGQPEQARLTLARLCRVHGRVRCEEGREAWGHLRSRYPQLADVDWPRPE